MFNSALFGNPAKKLMQLVVKTRCNKCMNKFLSVSREANIAYFGDVSEVIICCFSNIADKFFLKLRSLSNHGLILTLLQAFSDRESRSGAIDVLCAS